ncbi:hypothetical protein HJC23_013497 [Cyclotella cryptica]|uniref:Endonuclease/exonuclease/phosphatase domain-containing protein n=1 Tax=Cyclotella cryptica TaxID=29204 RepID=A0ABD3QBX0_9STRA|eukprot:CCRYP_006930-RA/>CCRYP_006930-RA protein AED:0.03 eAED:0.03 QI:289/1/1/1/0/0/2/218/530
MQMHQERACDRFGNACLVLTGDQSCHSGSSASIRLQDYTDADVASLIDDSSSGRLSTCANIRNKLEFVQNELLAPASPQTNVALHRRHWKPTSSNVEAPIANKHNNQHISFTVAQFNMLARGLSSGPNQLFPTPFLPHDDNFDGSYGGFTHLRQPQLVLDYHRVRKWRLLHVLLGGGLLTKEDDHASDIGAVGDTDTDFKARDTIPYDIPFDILALQEVDDYYSFWYPLLVGKRDKSVLGSQTMPKKNSKIANYQGVFQPKPNSPCVKFGWYSDGVALFWNEQKFNSISQPQCQQYPTLEQSPCLSATVGDTQNMWIEMGSFVGSLPSDNIPLDDPARIAAKNQVYIIVPLQITGSKKILIVATTHLKAKKGALNERIRHLQALELKRRVHNMAKTLQNCDWEDVNIVILGDFNSEPAEPAVQSILQQNDDSGWDMKFAYPPDSGHYTTWKARKNESVCRTIDHIFYSSSSKERKSKEPGGKEQHAPQCLQCSEILSVPKRDTIHELLPGFKYPSDHFLLAAKFRWEYPF